MFNGSAHNLTKHHTTATLKSFPRNKALILTCAKTGAPLSGACSQAVPLTCESFKITVNMESNI